jgi:uncharacterized protein
MPEYNERARLDPSQVQDRRGSGMGMPIAVGGGGIGIIFFIVAMLLGVNPSDIPTTLPGSSLEEQGGGDSTTLAQECQTGADANRREDCRLVLFINSIQEYWSGEFARSRLTYEPAQTLFFTQATQSGCGTASAQVGPFYCPGDRKVYIDLSFFNDLRERFGAQGGPFAQAYVLAHEYGHHVQNLTGTLNSTQGGGTGPQSNAVRVELQADCYAGVWANHAVATGYITRLTDADIADGLNAAATVGDDRIQKKSTGQVNPEQWTHGSAEQRQRWFQAGYSTGNPDACDTFSGSV